MDIKRYQMKLEIKHIAPYLPYGLRCKVVNDDKELIGTLTGLYADGCCVFADIVESEHGFESIKPLLKPLSELSDEEIEDIERREGIDCVNIIGFRTETLEYRTFQDLVSNHYDVFGLIDNGLAEVKG